MSYHINKKVYLWRAVNTEHSQEKLWSFGQGLVWESESLVCAS